jgi:hypothetical protein
VEEVTDEPLYRDRVCGIDIGKAQMVATIRVPSDRDPARRAAETRTFGTTKREVLALADWLRCWQVPAVVMEATSDYWKGPFYRLEAEGLECVLADAKQVKNLPGRPKRGNKYLGAILGETAVAAGRTQTREGVRHRRLARRRGTAKACVATGNTQLKASQLLADPGMRYEDLGADYYERQRDVRRQVAHHVGKLGSLGFEVTLCRIPEPDPDGTAPPQSA